MQIVKVIYTLILILFIPSLASASNFENRVITYVDNLANSLGESLSNTFKKNDRVKYLDLSISVKEHLKPTISVMNVNKIAETSTGAFFNQNSLSLHDNDQTVNVGLGHRSLMYDDKLMIGVNIFFDYAFDEQHQRQGAGLEFISSSFDLRSNYYDATSGIQNIGSGSTEEALDGWDTRLDFHLPLQYDVRLFGSIFEFENAAGNYELEGEKYGINAIIDRLNLEIGYIDDNKTGDGTFANISYQIPIGNHTQYKKKSSAITEYVSVRDRLYEPVKREYKIRVVKISAANIVVSGF
jgi:hypothetical protein